MMKLKLPYNKIIIAVLLFSSWQLSAQEEKRDTLQSRIRFCIDSLLPISDPQNTLQQFAQQMQLLQEGKDTVLSIVHLGDSHIQAGFLTGQVMRLLHQEYGNAGRGWIAPFKLSKTNEPLDYFINSPVKEWTAGRVIQSAKKSPIGPGGIGIETRLSDVRMDIGVTPKNGAGYSFNELVFYRDARAMPMIPTGYRKDSIISSYAWSPVVPGVLRDTFYINTQVDTLQLRSSRIDPHSGERLPAGDFNNIYYGGVLKNGQPGIIYHSIGVNGAMFVNYTDAAFMERLALLEPGLLIVSLGTNETFGRRFSQEEFAGQIHAFLELAGEFLPDTPILLTTPAECYRSVTVNKKKSYQRNEKGVIAVSTINRIAHEKGLACWDLFTATGGVNSCEQWFKGKFMGSDRIHFNREGYAEQGLLLYKALDQLTDRCF